MLNSDHFTSLTPVCHAVIRGKHIGCLTIVTKEVFHQRHQLSDTSVYETNIVKVLPEHKTQQLSTRHLYN